MTSARTNWYAARLASERKSAVEHKFHEPVGNGPLPDRVACKSCGYISCGCVRSFKDDFNRAAANLQVTKLRFATAPQSHRANELRSEISKVLAALQHLDLSKLPHPTHFKQAAGLRMSDYVRWYESSCEGLSAGRLDTVLYNLRKSVPT